MRQYVLGPQSELEAALGYQIRMVLQVETWLAGARNRDPATADRVDEAIAALRADGENAGPPLVVPVDDPASHRPEASVPGARTGGRWGRLPARMRRSRRSRPASGPLRQLLGRTGFRIARPGLDAAYQQQHLALTRARRSISNVAAPRLRLERQIKELEQHAGARGGQGRPGMPAGQDGTAERLASLRRQHGNLQAEEERLRGASRRLQAEVDAFRAGQEAIEAAYAAADEAAGAVWAEVTGTAGTDAEDASPAAGEADYSGLSSPAQAAFWRRLRELRPDAPDSASTRILFTVDPPDTAVLLAAGTENDWLDTGYDEIIALCQSRYEHEHDTR